MPIISAIGRKHWKVRVLFIGMYTSLILGACTMVYPFLLMISGSTKSGMDIKYFDALPRFLYDDEWMYAKHLEGLFNESVLNMDIAYDSDDVSFERLGVPDGVLVDRLYAAWEATAARSRQVSYSEKTQRDLVHVLRASRIPPLVDAEAVARGWEVFLEDARIEPSGRPVRALKRAWRAFASSSHMPSCKPNLALAAAWERFLNEEDIPFYAYTAGYLATDVSRTIPSQLREFKSFLAGRYGEDIDDVNRALGTEYLGWGSVYVTPPNCLLRREQPSETPFAVALNDYMSQASHGMRYVFSPEGFYKKQFLKVQYTRKIEEYNKTHGTSYADYGQIHLAREYPRSGTAKEREDWEDFVRNTLALQWVRVAPDALGDYQEFLRVKHRDISTLNKHYGTHYTAFEDISLIEEPPLSGMVLTDWEAFIAGWRDPETQRECKVAAQHLLVHSIEFAFQDWLVNVSGGLDAVNRTCGTSYLQVAEIKAPQKDLHRRYFLQNIRHLRWEFVTRNYRAVAEYMLFHGRGIINTVLYCSLAILSALLVNPLAAYAMSRYKMPSSYKILLFLMCTMAFPPMVTAIPNFLMLRQLNLLNTFAALILPGMANGYSIFLLKGFFDAQPQELYESAQLDGASEWTLFWRITMSLSKPILAVIALQAFQMAYSNFMFAFVVCQDEKMWTLMVWLYQLQQRSGQAVMYASLIIAAIPTFLIFLFCQNIIMRGIVVPSEK